MLCRLVSGGQTGVDRAALDVGRALGLESGGWCPLGRRAEDGTIPLDYSLRETASPAYAVRTLLNVRDSDATLILCAGPLSGGTAFTHACALRVGRPHLVVDLNSTGPTVVREWLQAIEPTTLNVAGPRESECPGIGQRAARFLAVVLGLSPPRA